MSVRGVPVQELPEHQAPEVAFILDEVTGAVSPLPVPVAEEPARPSRRRKRARTEEVADDADTPAGDGE